MQIINISPGRFRELIRQHLSLDGICLLQLAKEGLSLQDFKEAKINALVQGLKRKGLLEENGSISRQGEELLESLGKEEESPLVLGKVENNGDYKRWLEAYPPSDKWAWKGKSYPATRSLKGYKKEQEVKFQKILVEGDYTADELVRALIAEVYAVIERSLKVEENKMVYFINSESYLTQRRFQNFIEEGKELTEQQIKEYYQIIKGKGGAEPPTVKQTQKFL